MRKSFRHMLALSTLLLAPLPALAGAPYVTEDPEPAEYGHTELTLFSAGTRLSGETLLALPGIEANYGILPDVEAHLSLLMAYDTTNRESNYGYSDTELGFKYRFLHDDKNGWMPDVAVNPIIELPTGNVGRGLGAGHTREFLALWAQKELGKWQAFGGGGYWNNPGTNNYWFFGLGLQRRVTDSLSLGGELFHQSANMFGGATGADFVRQKVGGFNLGATYDFSDRYHLLFSAGRGIQTVSDSNEFSYYIGLRLNY